MDPFFSTSKTAQDKPKSRYKHGRTKHNNGHRFQEVQCIMPGAEKPPLPQQPQPLLETPTKHFEPD